MFKYLAVSLTIISTSLFAYPINVDHKAPVIDANKGWKGVTIQPSYTYGRHSGLKDKNSSIRDSDVFAKGYKHATKKNDTQIVELLLTYALTEQCLMMAKLPYVKHSVKTLSASLENGSHHVSGIADLTLSFAYRHPIKSKGTLLFIGGLDLPTGSIKKKNLHHVFYPYPQQPGSGTYNLLFDLKYLFRMGKVPTSISANSIIYLGKNSHHYALGNKYGVNISFQGPKIGTCFPYIKINGLHIANVRGRNSHIPEDLGIEYNPKNYGGTLGLCHLGIKIPIKGSWSHLDGFGLSFGMPFYQRYKGLHPKEAWAARLGCKLHF